MQTMCIESKQHELRRNNETHFTSSPATLCADCTRTGMKAIVMWNIPGTKSGWAFLCWIRKADDI